MFKTLIALTVSVVVLSGASAAFAADGKPAHPTVCESYSVAGQFGVCAARKAGGKPTLLRTYAIVEVKDSEGKPVKVMVGFR